MEHGSRWRGLVCGGFVAVALALGCGTPAAAPDTARPEVQLDSGDAGVPEPPQADEVAAADAGVIDAGAGEALDAGATDALARCCASIRAALPTVPPAQRQTYMIAIAVCDGIDRDPQQRAVMQAILGQVAPAGCR